MGESARLPEEALGALLMAKAWTLATAESCTGGLIGHRITNVAGSSAYYIGGVVSYSNDAKERLLGVKHESLIEHGAVSETVAREMADGARRRLGVDVAVAVTGIAGPGGGTAEKPVGLVYMAVCGANWARAERNVFAGDRDQIKSQTADRALRLLSEAIANVKA